MEGDDKPEFKGYSDSRIYLEGDYPKINNKPVKSGEFFLPDEYENHGNDTLCECSDA